MKTRIIRKITFAKLKLFLTLIGWDLKGYGCEHYRFFNEYKKMTQWTFFNGRIELDDIGEFQSFGKAPENYIHSGHFHLDLAEFNLELSFNKDNGGYDMLSVVPKKMDKNKFFISFYNTIEKTKLAPQKEEV